MNFEKICKIVLIYIALFVFAMICAAALAEGEVLAQYRWLVYLGTALAMLAFGITLCAVFFLSLWRLQNRIRKASELPEEERISSLGSLLAGCRGISFRALVSLSLADCYLRAGQTQKALSLLQLLQPYRCILFNFNARARLLRLCYLLQNDREAFDRCRKVVIRPEDCSFLSEEMKTRLQGWQEEKSE